MSLTLDIIVASTRPGRIGPALGAWAQRRAEAHGRFTSRLVDLASFELPLFDEANHPRMGKYEREHTVRWADSVRAADAFVFVLPEYNYFAPPTLINAIDYLASEWTYKAAGILSYGGIGGGLRAAESLKPLLSNMGVMPIPEGVSIMGARSFIGEDGTFTGEERSEKSLAKMLDELHRWAEALKPLRG